MEEVLHFCLRSIPVLILTSSEEDANKPSSNSTDKKCLKQVELQYDHAQARSAIN